MVTCFFGMKVDDSSTSVRISSGDSGWAPDCIGRMRSNTSSGVRMASVDIDSRLTNGAEILASRRIGQAINLAIASELCWPRRLGTSSPITIEK